MNMSLTPERFEAGFALFTELVETGDVELKSSFDATRARFSSAVGAATPDDTERRAAERRHLEWFLFEHTREASSGLVVEELLERWAERTDLDQRQASEAYLQSQTGIFEVNSAEEDEPVVLRELAGLGSFELAEQGLSAAFELGDLIVGRLFPLGEGQFHVSPGAGVFRDPRLLQAIESDLEKLRKARSHAVMRLSQLELEAMFWVASSEPSTNAGASAGEASEAVGELEEFLRQGGVSEPVIAGWFDRLRRTPLDTNSLVLGAGDALSEILEIVAFETDLDIERARSLFLAAWSSGGDWQEAERTPAPPSSSTADDVETVLAEFDRDRAAGIDVETSFRALERKLGLEGDEDAVDDSAPDFPGVVGAMVEEFLWETRSSDGEAESAAHEGLRLFASYASKIGVFENLGPRDLLAFAAFWLPESRQLKSGAEAERLMRALAAFGQWAVETHGVNVLEGRFDECLDALRKSLPRAVVANALLPRIKDVEGELFSLVGVEEQGLGRIRAGDGVEREVQLDARLSTLLESGDLFRGYTRDDGEFVVACCYPPEAAGLQQSEG